MTTHEKGSSYPRWSPDGRFIAYVSNPEPNNLYKLSHLCIVSPEGGPPVCLSNSLDRDVHNLVWDKDSKALYGLVPDKARVHVYKFTLEDKKIL